MLGHMTNPDTLSEISARIRQLGIWLEDAAPHVQNEQRHLDGGSPEQAYWHLGYRSGLTDVLAFIESCRENKSDNANRSPAADPDA
jgi:hypothetical protein